MPAPEARTPGGVVPPERIGSGFVVPAHAGSRCLPITAIDRPGHLGVPLHLSEQPATQYPTKLGKAPFPRTLPPTSPAVPLPPAGCPGSAPRASRPVSPLSCCARRSARDSGPYSLEPLRRSVRYLLRYAVRGCACRRGKPSVACPLSQGRSATGASSVSGSPLQRLSQACDPLPRHLGALVTKIGETWRPSAGETRRPKAGDEA